MTICHVPIACFIPKPASTHSEYAIHIAFPLQQWLHERASNYVIRALPVTLEFYGLLSVR
jgi:hypothetical protein